MFTQDNTTGFSQYDLDVMNAVLETLMSYSDEDDTDGYQQWEKAVSDAINNQWIEGMGRKDLEQSVRRALTLNK